VPTGFESSTRRAVQVGQGGQQVKSMSIYGVLEKIRDVNRSVARRAFELLQSSKREHGSDLNDWLHAESELIHASHVDVEDCDDVVVVRAEVPGFRSDELQFCVEPFRVTIVGVREISDHPIIRKMLYCDRCAEQVFRVINCPIELSSRDTTSSLKEGILELEIPKARDLPLATIAAAAYWILRPEDHRRWAAVFQEPFENNKNRNVRKDRQVSLALSL
jgi:HSP20 family molecular chaperone IbpA